MVYNYKYRFFRNRFQYFMNKNMDPTSNADTIKRAICAPAVEECTSRFYLGPKCNLLVDMMESLEELLKQTWTIWGVSCLFGFQSDELQLKLYAKRLREEVAAILPHDNATYTASFTVVESIETRPKLDDYPPLKIELVSKTNNGESKDRIIYTGVFISWRTTLTESSSNNTTKLPLLLCRGTKSAMNAVHTVVGHMFDCQIVSMSATEDELEWLVPMMLISIDDEQREHDKGQMRLEYRIPGLSATDTIAVDFEISALSKLWNVISERDEDENDDGHFVKAEHVLKFHETIKTQVLSDGGLHLGLCILSKISLPFFTMMDNRMKASTPYALHRFLLFFNDRSLKCLHTLDYDTTNTVVSETI